MSRRPRCEAQPLRRVPPFLPRRATFSSRAHGQELLFLARRAGTGRASGMRRAKQAIMGRKGASYGAQDPGAGTRQGVLEGDFLGTVARDVGYPVYARGRKDERLEAELKDER